MSRLTKLGLGFLVFFSLFVLLVAGARLISAAPIDDLGEWGFDYVYVDEIVMANLTVVDGVLYAQARERTDADDFSYLGDKHNANWKSTLNDNNYRWKIVANITTDRGLLSYTLHQNLRKVDFDTVYTFVLPSDATALSLSIGSSSTQIDGTAVSDSSQPSHVDNVCQMTSGRWVTGYVGGGNDHWVAYSDDPSTSWTGLEVEAASLESAGIVCLANGDVMSFNSNGIDVFGYNSTNGSSYGTQFTLADHAFRSLEIPSCSSDSLSNTHCCSIDTIGSVYYFNSTPWNSIQDIETDSSYSAEWCDIEVSSSDDVYIVYGETDTDDVYLRRSTDSFGSRTLLADGNLIGTWETGYGGSLDIQDNIGGIAWINSTDLFYTEFYLNNLSSHSMLLDSTASYYPSLALTEAGGAVVLYQDDTSSTGDVLVANSTDNSSRTNWHLNATGVSDTSSGYPSVADSVWPITNRLNATTLFVYTANNDFWSEWLNVPAAGPESPAAPDTFAPARVTSLTNTSTSNVSISLSWTNPSDPDFAYALVYRNNSLVQNTSGTTHTSNGLTPNSTYYFYVHTEDSDGNRNTTLDGGNQLYVNTSFFVSAEADVSAPAQVTGLTNTSTSNVSISLSWTNPSDPDFAFALVYRNGSLVQNTSGTTHTSNGLTPVQDYYFYVLTEDSTGNRNTTLSAGNQLTVRTANNSVAEGGGGEGGSPNVTTSTDAKFLIQNGSSSPLFYVTRTGEGFIAGNFSATGKMYAEGSEVCTSTNGICSTSAGGIQNNTDANFSAVRLTDYASFTDGSEKKYSLGYESSSGQFRIGTTSILSGVRFSIDSAGTINLGAVPSGVPAGNAVIMSKGASSGTSKLNSVGLVGYTTSTASQGFGTGFNIIIEDGSGNYDTGTQMGSVWENAVSGSENASFYVDTYTRSVNSAPVNVLTVNSGGSTFNSSLRVRNDLTIGNSLCLGGTCHNSLNIPSKTIQNNTDAVLNTLILDSTNDALRVGIAGNRMSITSGGILFALEDKNGQLRFYYTYGSDKITLNSANLEFTATGDINYSGVITTKKAVANHEGLTILNTGGAPNIAHSSDIGFDLLDIPTQKEEHYGKIRVERSGDDQDAANIKLYASNNASSLVERVTYNGSSNVMSVHGGLRMTDSSQCLMLRDTDDAGWTKCTALNGVLSCATDADGVC